MPEPQSAPASGDSTARNVVRTTLVVIFVALVIRALQQDQNLRDQLQRLDVTTFVIGGGLVLIIMMSLGFFLKVVVDRLADEISLFEATYTTTLATLANSVLPFQSGSGVRAVHLKQRYGLAYSDFVVTLYGNAIIVILVNGLTALAFLVLPFIDWGPLVAFLFVVLLGFTVMAISLISPRLRLDELVLAILARLPGRLAKRVIAQIEAVVRSWKLVTADRVLLSRMILVVVMNLLARLALFWFLFEAIGIHVRFPAAIILTALTNLTLFVALTPGAFGIREAILAVYAGSLGITQTDALSVSLAERAVTFVALITMTALFWLTRTLASGLRRFGER
jgi:uncharacterized protein (TIRG00374 family)